MGEGTTKMSPQQPGAVGAGEPKLVSVHTTETKEVSGGQEETTEIRHSIEQTRAQMGSTIEAIQEKLNPTTLKEQAMEKLEEAKDSVKEKVREELHEAKEAVKEQFQEAKEAVREATIGRVEHMIHRAEDTVSDARSTITETIRENPIPAVLVGLGLAWLLMNRRSGASHHHHGRHTSRSGTRGSPTYGSMYDEGRYGYGRSYTADGLHYEGAYYPNNGAYPENGIGGHPHSEHNHGAVGDTLHRAQEAAGNAVSKVGETAGNLAHKVGDTAGNVAHKVGDTAGNVAHQVYDQAGNAIGYMQHTAGHLAHEVQHQAVRLEHRLERTFRENPIAIGAAALALGTTVGLMLPRTRQEDEWIGETRDQFVGKAEGVAHEALDKVQRVAKDVTDQIKQPAGKEEANNNVKRPSTTETSNQPGLSR